MPKSWRKGVLSGIELALSKEKPFSLLLAKSVGLNNFWLGQFTIVGVGARTTFQGFYCQQPKTVGPTVMSQQLGKRCEQGPWI